MKFLFLGSRLLGKQALSFLLSQDNLFVDAVICEDHDLFQGLPVNFVTDDQEWLTEQSYDLILSVNYNRILREPLLSSARLGCFNVHHSYELRLRGRHCATHAILLARKTGVWEHGTSLHYMVPELDAGQIVDTRCFSMDEHDTAQTVFRRCEKMAVNIIRETVPRLLRGEILDLRPPTTEYYTFRKSDLPNKNIDLFLPPLQVFDLVRALTFPPNEGPYTIIDGYKRWLFLYPAPGRSCLVDAGSGRKVYG